MSETEHGSTTMDDILNMDDAVDQLTAQEVKDVWARGQFMHQIIKANGPRFMNRETCDDVQEMLSNQSNSGIKSAAIHGLGRDHPVTQSLGWDNGPGNVETLTRRLNKEYEFEYDSESDPDGLIETMRDSVKSAVRGSGMPRIIVMRERVKTHTTE